MPPFLRAGGTPTYARIASAKSRVAAIGRSITTHLSWVVLGIELVYNRYSAKKAESAARETAADSATINSSVVPSDSTNNLPVVYGRAVIRGINAYLATGQRAPWVPSASEVLGELSYYPGDGSYRDYVHNGITDRYAFLLFQDMLARHSVSEIRHVWVDGEDIDGYPEIPLVVQLGDKGTASDMATRFDEGYDGTHGNGLGERNAESRFVLGSFATGIGWNDVYGDGAQPAFRRVPVLNYAMTGAKLPSVELKNSAYAGTDAAYSNLAPLVLLDAYKANWGMGVSEVSQKTLQSIHGALAQAQKVMQGRGGLDTEAYPAIFNAIEGTAYQTYADAFGDRGYLTYNTLKRTRTDLGGMADMAGWETGWPSPAGGGTGRGDRFPRVHPAYGSRLIALDDQAWTIKFAEANGFMFPSDNRPEIFLEVLQRMPFASFSRQLESGERELRWPDLSGAVPKEDYTLTQDDFEDFSITPPSDPPTNARVSYNDAAEDGGATTHTLFDEERAGVNTNATDYFEARHGNRRNILRINVPFVDNEYAAAHVGWCAMSDESADRVAIRRNCINGYSDVGDILKLDVPSRSLSIQVLVKSVAFDFDNNIQEIGGIRLTPNMTAWPVARKRGSEEPEEQPTRAPAQPDTICATWEDDDQVVLIDFDCDKDEDGNPVVTPSFPVGCDNDVLYAIGSPDVRLPVYGPGNASYTLTGLPTGITYDADEHTLEVADSTAVGTHAITLNGTIGDNSASCTFNLRVVAADASFAVAITATPANSVEVRHEGGIWHVIMARSQRRVAIKATLRDLTGNGLPASASFTLTSPSASDRTATVNKDSQGGISISWTIDEHTDFTKHLEALHELTVVAGGDTREETIVVSRPRG